MPLIRNKNAAHVTHQAVALELENVRSQAESLLDSSRGGLSHQSSSPRSRQISLFVPVPLWGGEPPCFGSCAGAARGSAQRKLLRALVRWTATA